MEDITSRLKEAKDLEVAGKYIEADDCLTSILENVRTVDAEKIIGAAILNQRGVVRRMLRRYDDSFHDYQEALSLDPNDFQRALAYINMADIQRVARSDFGAAHASLDEALTIAGNGTLLHAKAVDQRGLVFHGQKDYDSEIKAYKRAREVCEALMKKNPGDKDVENRFGQVILHLAGAYIASNEPAYVDEAYESQTTALEIFTRLGDQQGIVNTVSNMGKIAIIRNNPDEAIAQYTKAWDILKETGYGRAITAVAIRMAEAYLVKKDVAGAKPYLDRFNTGRINGEVTNHDLDVMKEEIGRVEKLLEQLAPQP